jgi:hypothetical protein
LTELNPPIGGSDNRVLMTYCRSISAGDNGRAAVIQNNRTAGGGTAVHDGFGLESLLSRAAIACYLDIVLHSPSICGLTPDPGYNCSQVGQRSGVDAPEIANGFGFALQQATPNPFAEATSIRFSVANRTHVTLEVYNILGQRIRTLVDEPLEANSYERAWDGRSDSGSEVSSGIYFYKMVAGDFSATEKAVLLR